MDLVLLVLSTLAFFYVGLPLILWITGARIPPVRAETVAEHTPVPELAASHFSSTSAFFSSIGFERIGDRIHESTAIGFASYKQFWHHKETGETALAGTMLRKGRDAFSQTFVGFTHDLGNGALVATTNFILPARKLFDVPGSMLAAPIEDLHALRALHQGHIAATGARVQPLRVRDTLTFCKELSASERAVALSQKFYRTQGDALRITLKGAFTGIWINVPPLKWKYARRDRLFLKKAQAASESAAARFRSRAA